MERLRKSWPAALLNKGVVLPFGKIGQKRQGRAHGFAHCVGKQACGQGPDGFKSGEAVTLFPCCDVIRLGHRQLTLEPAGLARD